MISYVNNIIDAFVNKAFLKKEKICNVSYGMDDYLLRTELYLQQFEKKKMKLIKQTKQNNKVYLTLKEQAFHI